MDLEKAVNREVLWQGLRMYGVGGKLLIGFKSMYVDSLTCVKVKWGEREWFSNVIQGCILSPWLFTVYVDVVIKEVKMGDREEESEISEGWERVEIAWPLACR